MGKGGRALCIFTPLALTTISFVCVLLLQLGGYSKSSSTLNNLYFFQIDFSNYTSDSSTSELAEILTAARDDGDISDFYQIHLWNYCNGSDSTTSGSVTRNVTWCSTRTRNFWFDPLDVWDIEGLLNSTTTTTAETASSTSTSSTLSSIFGKRSTNITALEDEVLDKSTRDALATYEKVSKWMFAAYFASLWFLLAAVIFGIFSVCTRFMSLMTWLISIIATVLVGGASITATVMFSLLIAALKAELSGHDISIKLSVHTLAVTWLATICSLLATLFWLFSACCCSGKSNPHHFRNREATASGFLRGRKANQESEKATGYEPVAAPYAIQQEHDQVPLAHTAAPYGQEESPYAAHGEAADYYGQHTGSYESYRHN